MLACESIYYINMNTDVEEEIYSCPTSWLSGHMTRDKVVSHEIPGGHMNVLVLTSLQLTTSIIFVDYCIYFLVMKQLGGSVQITS